MHHMCQEYNNLRDGVTEKLLTVQCAVYFPIRSHCKLFYFFRLKYFLFINLRHIIYFMLWDILLSSTYIKTTQLAIFQIHSSEESLVAE